MWSYEHTITTAAAPEQVWRLWADVPRWGDWNVDIGSVRLLGPFTGGSEIEMITGDGTAVHLRLAEVAAPELFVDEAEIDGLLLRTVHRIRRVADGTCRVSYRMEITGPGADDAGELGGAVTADWPATMAALVARAEGR